MGPGDAIMDVALQLATNQEAGENGPQHAVRNHVATAETGNPGRRNGDSEQPGQMGRAEKGSVGHAALRHAALWHAPMHAGSHRPISAAPARIHEKMGIGRRAGTSKVYHKQPIRPRKTQTRCGPGAGCTNHPELYAAPGAGGPGVANFASSLSGHQSVRHFVPKLQPGSSPEARVVIETAPGEECQVDYGDAPVRSFC